LITQHTTANSKQIAKAQSVLREGRRKGEDEVVGLQDRAIDQKQKERENERENATKQNQHNTTTH
jgi:hypothetical protein